jgi:hypothetical protein
MSPGLAEPVADLIGAQMSTGLVASASRPSLPPSDLPLAGIPLSRSLPGAGD